jgi:hypothetical protein
MSFPVGATAYQQQKARKFKPGDKALMEALVARTGGTLIKGAFHGTHEGVEFRLRLADQSQRFILSVVCPPAGRFRITRAGRIDRWLASFLPAWPIPSRDPRFDLDMCVQTRDLEITTRVITQASHRRTIRSLLDGPGNAISLEGDRLKLYGPRAALGLEPGIDEVFELLVQIATLGTVVTDFVHGHEVHAEPKHDTPKILAWVSVVGLFLLGGAAFITATVQVPLLDAAGFIWMNLGIGFAAVPIVAFGLAHLVADRTTPGRLLIPVFLIALVAVPLATTGTACLLNGVLDQGGAEYRSTPITHTHTYKQKSKRRYKIGIDAWWRAGDVRWFKVGRETYDNVQGAGDWSMEMLIRPGAFGQPWIEQTNVVRDEG